MNCKTGHVLKALLLCLALCGPAGISAQTTYKDTEEKTYRYYLDGSWDSLLVTGRKAIRNGIDYYFLRNRMGLAYDAKGKYIRSAWQYEKALGFNRSDPFSAEKEYFALLNSNRRIEARAMEAVFTGEQQERLTDKDPVLNAITVDLGYGFNNAYDKFDRSGLTGTDSIYGEADLFGDYYFATFSFAFNVTKRFTLTASYSYLNFSKRKYIAYGYPDDRLDSTVQYYWGYKNFWSFPWQKESYAFDYALVQHEFYLSGTVVLGNNVKLMPAFRLVSAGNTNTTAAFSATVVQDTAYHFTGTDLYATFPFLRARYTILQRDTSWYNWLVSLAATRDFDIFTVGMSGSWSNFNNHDQLQASGSLTYFPLGNLDLYGTTGVTMLSQDGDGRLLFAQMVGGKVTRWMWAEADLIYGDLSDANTANGMVIYNNTEKVKYRLGSKLIFTPTRMMECSLNYQFFEKESPAYYYVMTGAGPGRHPQEETTWHRSQTHSVFIEITVKL